MISRSSSVMSRAKVGRGAWSRKTKVLIAPESTDRYVRDTERVALSRKDASVRRRRTWADWTRPLWRVGNRLEAWELRRLGTSGMKLLRRSDLLALETTGRRTGRRRRVPLAYWVTDEGSYMVGGGAAGMTRVDWV